MIFLMSPLSAFLTMPYFVFIISSLFINSPLNLWVLMEFSMFLFMSVGFLSMTKEELYSEGILVYYLTQSGFSMALLCLMLLSFSKGISVLLTGAFFVLLAKLGLFPLNFWFYSVMMKSNTLMLFYMMTLQKLPILMFFKFLELDKTLFYLLVLLNLLVGGAMALMMSDLKSLIISSSLANNSWLIFSVLSDLGLFLAFFVLYSWTLYFVFFSSMFNNLMVLSLSGLPPFPLFFLKFGIVSRVLFLDFEILNLMIALLFMLFGLLLSASYVRYYMSVLFTKFSL